MNTATICLLLKQNKDPTSPASYRPLSLINADTKIISKTLALRIEKVTPHIIHPDQTGFMKGRHSATNLRRLYNIIHYASLSKEATAIFSLDAEKAFDKVNWEFLFSALKKFGFGESFLHWVKILYSSPLAQINTNGIISQRITLHRGTRQGCPLSPSLFTIFIEPLAAAIRQNGMISGINTQSINHKISLYADDILLYLVNPSSSLREAISLINSFSLVSDYTINWSKSTILPLNLYSSDLAALASNLSLDIGNIKYLGINISPRLSELYTLNLKPLLRTI